MSHTYLFVLGRTPDLAYLELRHLLPDAAQILPDIVSVSTNEELVSRTLIQSLGGTVKIAQLIGTTPHLTAMELADFFGKEGKEIHFGVSGYGTTLPPSLLTQMKKMLEQKGMHARYASSRHGETLSSVTVDKQHLAELIVVKTPGEYLIGRTEAVQPYEQWGKRDYGRPYADAKSGMLPPKVARMLVNIAGRPGTLLDPFCGMGTVLSEAYLAGWRVFGSDISAEIVRKATANLEWLTKQRPSKAGEVKKMFVSDAVHVSEVLGSESVDAVVTEPFMGSTNVANTPNADPSEVKNIIKGLEKLYIGCLRDWSKILIPGGIVVIALPEYAVGGRTYFVKKVIDMCENLGYTIDVGPIAYSRPQATVRRMFYVFRRVS